MKVRYQFANEVVEIEVAEEWGDVLVDLDRREYNNDHRETRRHVSMDMMIDEQGVQFSDNQDQHNWFARSINTLPPEMRELLYKVYLDGKTLTSIACEEGVSKMTISNRLHAAIVKLKESF